MRRAVALLLAAGVLGCDFLAPVVTTFPGTGLEPPPCDPPPGCEALDMPPPAVESLADIFRPDDVCGVGGRQLRTLRVSDDMSIDVDDLLCVDLDVEVVGGGASARILTLRGDALSRARIHVHSAGLATELHADILRVDASELSLDGPIAVTFDGVQTIASRILLEAVSPLEPAQILIAGGGLADVEIGGARGSVRLEGTYVRRAIFDVRSLVIAGGRLDEVAIDAELLEMLDADLSSAEVRVGRLIAATGLMNQVHIARCGEVTLSQLSLSRSFVARCDAPLDVRDVGFEHSTVAADVIGRGGGIRHSVFGGERAELDNGEIIDSALCGTASIDVSAISCVRCEPSAPPDVCAVVAGPEPHCPGLCASTCMEAGEPTLDPELCAP
jgi:hypothetical protein